MHLLWRTCFGTCATSPITLAVYANKLKWVGGDTLCEYEGFMLIFAGFSTIFIVGSMAIDRYLAIKHPFFYDRRISFGKAKYLIVTLWAIAAIISSLPLIGLGDNIKQFPGTWCFFTFTSTELKNQIFAYFYATLGLLVIGVTALSNIFVTLGLLQMRRKAVRNMKLVTYEETRQWIADDDSLARNYHRFLHLLVSVYGKISLLL